MSRIDPCDASTYNQRTITLSNRDKRKYLLIDQKPASPSKGTVFCFHGYPDLWYGYRYLIKAFVEQGYRCIVPSLPGYIGTDAPKDLKGYGCKAVSDDMNAILDELSIDKVHVVGHDWGGLLAWRFTEYYPQRVVSIAVLCTPYNAPAKKTSKYTSLESAVQSHLPNFGYQVYFMTEEGRKLITEKPETILQSIRKSHRQNSSNTRMTGGQPDSGKWTSEKGMQDAVRRIHSANRPLPSQSEDPEYHYYIDSFRKSEMHNALNWYKTRQINFEDEREFLSNRFPKHIPALFLRTGQDAALPTRLSTGMLKHFPGGNCTIVDMPQGDHWVLQDPNLRDQAIDAVESFLKRNGERPKAKL